MKILSRGPGKVRNNGATLSGFTLLEVIITLTVGALLMAVILPYLGTSVTKSSEPLSNLRNTLSIYRTLENMTADYRSQQANSTLDLVALQNDIGGEGTDNNNGYGDYHVVENRFILFDGGDQEASAGGSQHVLKVIIRPVAFGATFTTLFTDEVP
ncbi:MAG: type II secretion system protein [Desulfobacterales bacterium]|nr:type II secretion system protein [Desulfobacterales bacterium]